MPDPEKVVVIGAGPVGALAALYAARRGDQVEVYELRSDLRDPSTTPLNFTKSINLALSERGINSLREAECPGLLDSILADTIPMHGRMIHGRRKATGEIFEESQKYDVHGRFIRAADRAGLNKRLLDELENMSNVTLHFNHKLTGADFNRKVAWFEAQHPAEANAGKTDPYSSGGDADIGDAKPKESRAKAPSSRHRAEEIEVKFDFMIGADGAHSATRYHLMKYARMNYQQDYIDTLWCEFTIPPADSSSSNTLSASAKDGFKLNPNHLHIWPAGSFMFIAIPSLDKSFTCTLFMPASYFSDLDAKIASTTSTSASSSTNNPIADFFRTYFPGVTPSLINPEDLLTQYKQNPHLPLISLKCTPYHYSSSVAILGDAAHAMVPFYGQGMNAGLEDVRVLFSQLDAHSKSDRSTALAAYTHIRTPDAHSINDLAMTNYTEMRSSVRSPLYLLRKGIEEWLDARAPWSGFKTQYARVSFSNQRYSEVVRDVRWQGVVLERVVQGVGVGVVGAVVWGVVRGEWVARAVRAVRGGR